MLVKEKRLEFQKTLEEYIEEQKLYELFESMMKGLIIDQPANPIEYLEKKLQAQESKWKKPVTVKARRIVLIGPPGSKRKEIALTIADAMSEEGN